MKCVATLLDIIPAKTPRIRGFKKFNLLPISHLFFILFLGIPTYFELIETGQRGGGKKW
jgi:hypothetical protein